MLNLDSAQRLDIKVKRGDSANISINMSNDDGTPLNLTEFEGIAMNVKQDRHGKGTALITKEKTAGISGDATGVLLISLFPSDTILLTNGVYYYDIEFSKSGFRTTYFSGKFIINSDISTITLSNGLPI